MIHAYHAALDALKTRYNVSAFNLVGYSGGAAVAVLVAADRADIASIRTVGGNLDYATFTALHKVSPMTASIDPRTAATRVAHIPQYHFIGRNDKVVPAAVFESWQQLSGNDACISAGIIDNIDHVDGWSAQWPTLLQLPLPCQGAENATTLEAPVDGTVPAEGDVPAADSAAPVTDGEAAAPAPAPEGEKPTAEDMPFVNTAPPGMI